MQVQIVSGDVESLAALLNQAIANAYAEGQHAERKRCREIVITMGGPDVPELLRQIDSEED